MSSFVCQTTRKDTKQGGKARTSRVRFTPKKDGAAEVKRKLESTYPKLVEGGGGGNNPS